jgi:hypothetical protein
MQWEEIKNNLTAPSLLSRHSFSAVDQCSAVRNGCSYRAFSTKTIPAANLPFNNLVELQTTACKIYKTNKLFGTRKGNQYEWMTYEEFGNCVDETRKVLKQHDIGFDDKVALISNNRVEWASILYSTQSLGGQVVPM